MALLTPPELFFRMVALVRLPRFCCGLIIGLVRSGWSHCYVHFSSFFDRCALC